uniref:Uncharacterized protein n=1 Tax=Clytia hemisphaerica TaxID=252671 RepID=A0A7M5WK69_9CNID
MDTNTSYSSGCMTVEELDPSILFSATRENKGKWWKKKFLGNLQKLKIQNEAKTKVVILSGTHGKIEEGNKFKTALNNVELYKEPQFYHNDKLDKEELETDPRTNKMIFEVIDLADLGDYGQRNEKLAAKLKAFSPTVVILAYCHSVETIRRTDDPIHEAFIEAGLLEDTTPPIQIVVVNGVDDLEEDPPFGNMNLGAFSERSSVSNEEGGAEKK